jgi:ABC-type lipoprotein export system ATPase subunit
MCDKICHNGAIWDLHIHTNKCPKSKGEFSKLDTKDFIDELCSVFVKYPDLTMISFTDHNQISTEVYEDFLSRNTNIKIIPGIEIDVDFEDKAIGSKHLIVYFDNSKINLKLISEKVNSIMSKYSVSDQKPIKISKLISEFVDEKLNFLLSPHAFKQKERGINEDWVGGETNKRAKKYVNQFFCFWESSGLKEITRAKYFLKTFFDNEDFSIVSFSDSSNFKKLKDYLDNPPVYFHSLSTFKGIQMVGSDSSRIALNLEKISKTSKSKLIGEIQLEDNNIFLSSKLNTIIGGRGSGKSILLDKIALDLGLRLNTKYKKRNEYLSKFKISLKDLNGELINSTFRVDYFDQNYVSKIFNSEDRNKELEEYFNNEFSKIDRLNADNILLQLKEKYDENLIKSSFVVINDNLGNLIDTFKIIPESDIPIKIIKNNIPKVKLIDNFDLDQQHQVLTSSKVIPKELEDNSKINDKIYELENTILSEIETHNINVIHSDYLENVLMSSIYDYKKDQNDDSKNKDKTIKLLEAIFNKKINKYLDRVSIVNALISLKDNKFTFINENTDNKKEELAKFSFKRELKFENPIEYFVRIFDDYVSTTSYPHEISKKNFFELINTYCTDIENYKKTAKNIDNMDEELKNLKLNSVESNKIYYSDDDIESMSPGSQTNILMEYIVKSDSSVPLLIDQPEDNVDNNAIYNDLTKWLGELKYRRQIIVVTHDANIVINSDAENLIIANQVSSNHFNYKYGALEYNNNLEVASVILDGGTDAVKRRLLKYGE